MEENVNEGSYYILGDKFPNSWKFSFEDFNNSINLSTFNEKKDLMIQKEVEIDLNIKTSHQCVGSSL